VLTNGVLIFSGYNQRAVLAFCRFAHKSRIDIFIVAESKQDAILSTDYKKCVIAVRKKNDLLVEDIKSYIKIIQSNRNNKQIIILPTSEFLNRFLLRNRKEIEENNVVIPLCSRHLYEEISNKYSFGKLCASFGIKMPKEYYASSKPKFPFVAKPKCYFSSTGEVIKPIILTSNCELKEFRKKYIWDDFYYQEYLEGKSFYLLYYISRGGSYSVFSQENLIQQSQGKSIIAAKSSCFHRERISSAFVELLLQKKYFGLIMIELRLYRGNYYMIEANPRLWGPSQLILDAGMDLFDRFCLDYGLIEELPVSAYKADTKYFWSGGLIQDLTQGDRIAFHNYTADDFIYDYHRWIGADIYLRQDSIKIYLRELMSDSI
jgi:predicted ATP-grasp superfamily ATP-dependent carboligase